MTHSCVLYILRRRRGPKRRGTESPAADRLSTCPVADQLCQVFGIVVAAGVSSGGDGGFCLTELCKLY